LNFSAAALSATASTVASTTGKEERRRFKKEQIHPNINRLEMVGMMDKYL